MIGVANLVVLGCFEESDGCIDAEVECNWNQRHDDLLHLKMIFYIINQMYLTVITIIINMKGTM